MSKYTGASGKVPLKEKDSFPQGRSGGKVMVRDGVVGSVGSNPRSGGGINRATKGTRQR